MKVFQVKLFLTFFYLCGSTALAVCPNPSKEDYAFWQTCVIDADCTLVEGLNEWHAVNLRSEKKAIHHFMCLREQEDCVDCVPREYSAKAVCLANKCFPFPKD